MKIAFGYVSRVFGPLKCAATVWRSHAAPARLCAAVALALTACSPRTPAIPLADPTATAAAIAAPTGTYVIGPGDTLSIFVYHNTDLTTDLPVRPDGRISMPLIRDIQAAGKTPSELSDDIAKALTKYVKDPTVTVTVKGFVGPFDKQIRVIGEATDPSAIAYRDRMTVLDVMIATKGLTKFAAGNSAVIIRRYEGQQRSIHVRLNDLIRDGDISQNVEMLPGDTLIIPQTYF